MPYTYTDRHGDELNVPQHPDKVRLEVPGRLIDIEPEDAPAVALAILEAAGIDSTLEPKWCDGPHEAAAYYLAQHQDEKRQEAEREAEDAKVREFRESSLSAFASVFSDSNYDSTGWEGLSETGREGWRTRYRAARKFFEES